MLTSSIFDFWMCFLGISQALSSSNTGCIPGPIPSDCLSVPQFSPKNTSRILCSSVDVLCHEYGQETRFQQSNMYHIMLLWAFWICCWVFAVDLQKQAMHRHHLCICLMLGSVICSVYMCMCCMCCMHVFCASYS